VPQEPVKKVEFKNPDLCVCGRVVPLQRYAARVNSHEAYWPEVHPHDIARLVRDEVQLEDIQRSLREINNKEIGFDEIPIDLPDAVAVDALFKLRYSLDVNELHNRHVGDLIRILEKEITAAGEVGGDPDERRGEIERKLQKFHKARHEQRHAIKKLKT